MNHQVGQFGVEALGLDRYQAVALEELPASATRIRRRRRVDGDADGIADGGILAVVGTILVAVGFAIAIWMDSEDPEVERQQRQRER